MAGRRTVTMRDVAREAGVSRMTVSRALREGAPISPETRDRILRIVHRMNYVPDGMAGGLSSKRSGFVAALVPSLNNLHFAETVQALTEGLETQGRQLLLGHTGYVRAREAATVEAMLRRRPEAVLLSYDGHARRTVELLEAAGVPVIQLWETPEAPIEHTVGFSNRDAAAAMTRALIGRGYRRIAFLGEAAENWTRGEARRLGWARAMREAGLDASRLVRLGQPPLSVADGAAAVDLVLGRHPDTDCLLCVSDPPAFGALSALRLRGVAVPGRMGVAGFGDFEVSRFSEPRISTVAVDPRALGAAAADILERVLGGAGPADPIHVRVPVRIELRESTPPVG